MEGKNGEADRFVFRWGGLRGVESVYGGSVNYVYSVCFFVAVFLSPVLYLVWLWGVCWVMCVEGGFSEEGFSGGNM